MSRKYKIRDQERLYFTTFTVIHWIDAFIRDEYRQTFISSTRYCQEHKGLEVYGYCIMPSHIHMILGTAGLFLLEGIIRDLKSFTSRSIRKQLEGDEVGESRREWMLNMMYREGRYNSANKDFQFWQQHSHPIELADSFMVDQKLEYIHQNPVTAGFVDEPEAWVYSSARDYAGIGKGYLDLIFV